MIGYLDSSIVLRILFGEPNPLRELSFLDLGISSELLRVECLRVVDRVRLLEGLTSAEVVKVNQEIHRLMLPLEVVKVTPLILGMASQPYPSVVRTLDAIHLASALLWKQSREEEIVFMTHDSQLAEGARALGFEVAGS